MLYDTLKNRNCISRPKCIVDDNEKPKRKAAGARQSVLLLYNTYSCLIVTI